MGNQLIDPQRYQKANHIINMVKVLRTKQKLYFKTRDKRVLEECKAYEASIDELIKQYDGTFQGKLF